MSALANRFIASISANDKSLRPLIPIESAKRESVWRNVLPVASILPQAVIKFASQVADHSVAWIAGSVALRSIAP